MHDAPPIRSLKIALRTRICGQCDSLNAVGAAPPPARDCEEKCLLFIQTPRLARLIEQSSGEPVIGYGEVVEHVLRTPCPSEHQSIAFQTFGIEALTTIEQFVARPARPA
jgi:hypothetical protein